MTMEREIRRDRPLTEEEIKSRENMSNLGKEYLASAQMLKERAEQLKRQLDVMPLCDRKRAELRIALIEQEIRETKRIGAEASGFYESGHRFLPKQNKNSVYPGAYLC